MIKKFFLSTILLFVFLFSAMAQPAGQGLKTFRVAIFSPLYLDSVFNGNSYKYAKSFPKFALPGLNFVQGAQIALDSMSLTNSNINATVFDSKSATEDISVLVNNHKLDSIDLIIGAVKDADFSALAAFARRRNIPFISTVYPNDGGVTENPFLVIVNSTLKAHCEAIYSYLLQNHGTDKIFLCRRPGMQEDRIADYFKMINEKEGKPLLNIQFISPEQEGYTILEKKLDSTRKNILVGGSLNEDFATELFKNAYALKKTYPVTIFGMPNWDGFEEIKKTIYKDMPVFYTTPFVRAKTDIHSKKIQTVYMKKYKAMPTEMTFRGYETVYLFVKLFAKYPLDFVSHLNDYSYKIFNSYNFKPVYLSNKNVMPDYFENKHIHFMKIVNGKTALVM